MFEARKVTFTHQKVSADFALGNSLFEVVKMIKNANFDKLKYFHYGIGFGAHGSFLSSEGSGFGKNMTIFGSYMRSILIRRLMSSFSVKAQWVV